MRGSVGPPRPAASIRMTAEITGDPKIIASAAKLPAADMTSTTWLGASFFAVRTAKIASPEPSAITGMDGPSTSPRPNVASEANRIPGRLAGSVAPAPKPKAGTLPPLPGRRMIANAVIAPAMTRTGSGHHHGAGSNPSARGRLPNTPYWIQGITGRNAHATSDTPNPTKAATTSRRRYAAVRMIARGSMEATGWSAILSSPIGPEVDAVNLLGSATSAGRENAPPRGGSSVVPF